MCRFEEFQLVSPADGTAIYGLCALPESRPVAILQLVHGMSEHKERYKPVMEFLCAAGYACVIHDHRGHGTHAQILGYMGAPKAGGLIQDILSVDQWAKSRFPHLPLFLFGHSMGSLAVRAFIRRYDAEISGLLVSGCPSYNPGAPLGKGLSRLMSRFKGDEYRSPLIQHLAFSGNNRAFEPAKSENAWLCSDEAVVTAYDGDPLCGFTFTLNGFETLFTLMEWVYAPTGWAVNQPNLPIYFLSGGDDPCRISDKAFEEAQAHLRKAGYANVTGRLYPGMRHEILNEDGKEAVFQDILEHLEKWRGGGTK